MGITDGRFHRRHHVHTVGAHGPRPVGDPGPQYPRLSASCAAMGQSYQSVAGNDSHQRRLAAAAGMDGAPAPALRGGAIDLWYSASYDNGGSGRCRQRAGYGMNLYTIPLSRNVKQFLLMIADAVMLSLAAWLSYSMLGIGTEGRLDRVLLFSGAGVLLSVVGFYRIGLYRALLLYIGLQSGFIVLQGVTVAAGLFGAVYYIVLAPLEANNAVVPIFWMLSLLFVGGSRFVAKLALQSLIQNFRPKEPVIIYGAGSSGMQLAAALQSGEQYLPVAF